MGCIIIASILTTYEIAQRYTEPDFVIALVTLLTISLLVITQVIVGAFEKVVYSRVHETLQIKELLELRDQFVHIAVHDLASAATAIKWGLRTIEPRTTAFSPIEKEMFGNVRDRNERLIELARQMLSITKIESGQLALDHESVEPSLLITKALSDIARTIKEKHITVIYDAPKESLAIASDREQLSEIFRILLINSINHINPEHGMITIALTSKDKDAIEFMIENNGQEINPETRAHVFEKFWRKHNNGVQEIAGTNFGLYIAKSLVEMLGGSIRFTSEPEKTAFILTFPRK